MSAIYGVLNLNDTDRVFLSTIGQNVIYDAVTEVARMHNEEIMAAMNVFVQQETSDHKLRYKLPMNGRMQRRGGQSCRQRVSRRFMMTGPPCPWSSTTSSPV